MRDEGGGDEGTVLLQPILGVIGHLISQANWTLADLLFEDDVFAQPRQEFVEGELASVVERISLNSQPLHESICTKIFFSIVIDCSSG